MTRRSLSSTVMKAYGREKKDLDAMEIRCPFDSTHVLGVLLVQW